MLRRGVGVGALQKRERTQDACQAVGAALESESLAHLRSALTTFRDSLEHFAFEHKHAIRSDPVFRAQFHAMCRATGVDPLACHKGWASALGIGDFYFELGQQIVDVCVATRAANGGLITLHEVLVLLNSKYKLQQGITLSDQHTISACVCTLLFPS